MTVPTITIRFAVRCAECRKRGATDNGLCVSCTGKALRRERMVSARGRAVQRAVAATLQRMQRGAD